MKRRSLMLALFVLSIAQTTFAAVDIKRQDPNDVRNPAGLAYHQNKKAGAVCPFADKNGREKVQKVAVSDSSTSRSKALPTSGNRHRQ